MRRSHWCFIIHAIAIAAGNLQAQEKAPRQAMGKAMLILLGENKKQALSPRSAEQLLQDSREAYTLLDRVELSKALAAKGVAAMPQLNVALGNEHWHVRHCALMALKELAKTESNRTSISSLVSVLGKLVGVIRRCS